MAEIEYGTSMIDGVPTYWYAGPPTTDPRLSAVLVFGVGRRNETLVASGISHLVEHLALATIGRADAEYNGIVDMHRTTFVVTGTPENVRDVVAQICARLGNLPVGRLVPEARILLVEAARRGVSPGAAFLGVRFGARSFGLAAHPEHGLRVLDEDAVRVWARTQFSRANAALVLSGPPPADLHLTLADGARSPTRDDAPLPMRLPARTVARGPWSGVSLVGRRSYDLIFAAQILRERALATLRERGVSYAVAAEYEPISAGTAQTAIWADHEPGAPAAAEVLWRVSNEAPGMPASEDELARLREEHARQVRAAPLGILVSAASQSLLDGARFDPAALLAEASSVTPTHVGSVIRDALGTALVVAQPGSKIESLDELPVASDSRIGGRTYTPTRIGAASFGSRARLTAGPEGVMVALDRGKRIVIPTAACAAVVWSHDGARHLTGTDGATIGVSAGEWKRGASLVRAIDDAFAPELFVPADGGRSIGAPPLARWRPPR